MDDAVAEYDRARGGAFAWMLGRFVVPASRVEELGAAIGGREPFALSVIVDAMPGAQWFLQAQQILERVAGMRGREPNVRIEALEVPLTPLLTMRDTFDASIGQFAMLAENAGVRELPAYLELPRGDRWRDALPTAMFALRRHRLFAKLRCGGLVAEAVPPAADVAAFIAAAAEEGVAFKATAGLHHPIRHWNAAAGHAMHGFVNVLSAAAFALSGVPPAELEEMLGDERSADFALDESGLRWREMHADLHQIETMRRNLFHGYGSCSFDEPVEDLTALGILER
jgi:hypothetical protein